jgi:hypothetical protein
MNVRSKSIATLALALKKRIIRLAVWDRENVGTS